MRRWRCRPPGPGRAGARAWLVMAGVAVAAVMVATGTVQATAGGPAGHGSPALRGYRVTTPRGALPAIWRLWQPGQAHFAWDPASGPGAPGSARISASLRPGDSRWTELDASAAAPPGAAFAEIWLKSAHDPGTVWFDDVTWTRPGAS